MNKKIDYWHRAYTSFLILGIFQICIAVLVLLALGSSGSLPVFFLATFSIVLALLLKTHQRYSLFLGSIMLLGALVFNAIFRGFGVEQILVYALIGYLLWTLYKAYNQTDIVV